MQWFRDRFLRVEVFGTFFRITIRIEKAIPFIHLNNKIKSEVTQCCKMPSISCIRVSLTLSTAQSIFDELVIPTISYNMRSVLMLKPNSMFFIFARLHLESRHSYSVIKRLYHTFPYSPIWFWYFNKRKIFIIWPFDIRMHDIIVKVFVLAIQDVCKVVVFFV